jgi:hypothetical protein
MLATRYVDFLWGKMPASQHAGIVGTFDRYD